MHGFRCHPIHHGQYTLLLQPRFNTSFKEVLHKFYKYKIRLYFIKVYLSCFHLLCYMVAVKLDQTLKCSTLVRASYVKEQNKYIGYGY